MGADEAGTGKRRGQVGVAGKEEVREGSGGAGTESPMEEERGIGRGRGGESWSCWREGGEEARMGRLMEEERNAGAGRNVMGTEKWKKKAHFALLLLRDSFRRRNF